MIAAAVLGILAATGPAAGGTLPPVSIVVEEGALPVGALEEAIVLRGGTVVVPGEPFAGVWTVRVALDLRVVVGDPDGAVVVDRRIEASGSAAARARTISLIVVEALRASRAEPEALPRDPIPAPSLPAPAITPPPKLWRICVGVETTAAFGPFARAGAVVGARVERGHVGADLGVGVQGIMVHDAFRPESRRAFPGNALQLRSSLGLRSGAPDADWLFASGVLGELELGEARLANSDDVARAIEGPGAAIGPWFSVRRNRGALPGIEARLSLRVSLLPARTPDGTIPIEPSVALALSVPFS